MGFQDRRVVLFAQFFALAIDDDGNMTVLGRSVAKSTVEVNLPRSRCEQITATNDMGDALKGIVDADGELIAPALIASAQDEIARFRPDSYVLRTPEKVDKSSRTSIHQQSSGYPGIGPTVA